MIFYGVSTSPSKEEIAQRQSYSDQVAKMEQARQEDASAAALRKHNDRVEQAISHQQVFIGMTRDEVVVSWGRPESSNVTLTARGKYEQLVYGSNYLYLDDDILTSIQTHQ